MGDQKTTAVSREEYLKKYLTPATAEEYITKKKHKPKVPVKQISGFRIIDVNIDMKSIQPHNKPDEEMETGDDAPVIVESDEIMDMKYKRGMIDHEDSTKWKKLGRNMEEKSGQSDDSSSPLRNMSSRIQRHDSDSDCSPPRKSNMYDSDGDIIPSRKRTVQHIDEMKAKHRLGDKEYSRTSAKQPSLSEDRSSKSSNSRTYHSPVREKHKSKQSRNKSGKPDYQSDDSLSPVQNTSPRRKSRHDSDSDCSPPRKSHPYDSDGDISTLRRRTVQDTGNTSTKHKHKRYSSGEENSSISSDRYSLSHQKSSSEILSKSSSSQKYNSSPKSKHKSDYPGTTKKMNRHSPSNDNLTSIRNTTYKNTRHDSDSDFSPPRKDNLYDSDGDASPIRKKTIQDDNSNGKHGPIIKSEPGTSSNQHSSPQRKHCNEASSKYSNSQEHDSFVKRKHRSSESYLTKEDRKMKETLSGLKAGLQNASALRKENHDFKLKQKQHINEMGAELSGRHAETVYRDRKTGKRRNLEEESKQKKEEEAKKAEKKAKYDEWGKGLVQKEERKKRLEEDVHEMSKPLARYKDDGDLDKELRERDREGDPMLAYIRNKREEEAGEEGKAIPKYKGPPPPPNRFGIPPGYRWDGVDRSNGFEKKYFEKLNEKKAKQEEMHLWSVQDM